MSSSTHNPTATTQVSSKCDLSSPSHSSPSRSHNKKSNKEKGDGSGKGSISPNKKSTKEQGDDSGKDNIVEYIDVKSNSKTVSKEDIIL